MSKCIYLIRHGQTAWSLSGQHTGLTDIPLTEQGRADSLKLKTKLQGKTFAKVWTSPLKRAKETCALSGWMDQATIDPDLVEWDYGDFEGLTHTEIQKIQPGWNVFSAKTPGGETIAHVQARADRVLNRVRATEGNVILFSSGHFLRLLTARWLQLAPEQGKHFLLSPASISILGFERNNPVIILWNLIS